TADLYRSKRELVRDKVLIDFGLWGAITPETLTEIPGQWREGARGFKAFMVDSPGFRGTPDPALIDAMRSVAALGGLVLVHAENDALVTANTERLRSSGRTDPLAHHESRPPVVEEEAIQRALLLAREAGVRVQIVHVSTPQGADLIRRARAA